MNEDLAAVLAPWERPDAPGCAVAVVERGNALLARGYGCADLEHRVPIATDTVFDVGSTAKQFAAAALALLVREGGLSLDDDVRRFVPELPEYASAITLGHLVFHTSGLRDYIALLFLTGATEDERFGADECLGLLCHQRALNCEPGTRYLYTNSGYFLLSVVVERVSGTSFSRFARERIFAPLEMTSTRFRADAREVVPGRAHGYEKAGDGYRLADSRLETCGDGGLFTTVEDLLRWQRCFLEPGDGGLGLAPQMLQPGRLAGGEMLDYAWGLVVDTRRGLRRVHHGGSSAAFRSEAMVIPERGLAIVCLANTPEIDAHAVAVRLADVVVATGSGSVPSTLLPPCAASPPAEAAGDGESGGQDSRARFEPAALVGRYLATDGRSVVRIELAEGAAWIRSPTLDGRLVSRADGSLVVACSCPELVLHLEPGGPEVSAFALSCEESPAETYTRFELVDVPAEDLERFAGSYLNDEIGAVYELTVDDGVLSFAANRGLRGTLGAIGPGRLLCEASELVFAFEAVEEGPAPAFVLEGWRDVWLDFVRT